MDEIEGQFSIKSRNKNVFIDLGGIEFRDDSITALMRNLKQILLYKNQKHIKIRDGVWIGRPDKKDIPLDCHFCGSKVRNTRLILVYEEEGSEFVLHEECILDFVDFLVYLDENPEDYIQHYI